ncbi:DCC1-like thiol-disulfide oxidoreductase family protein [Gymnodinialimonas sp. 2305UL16-5]|uniref:DCC1-like thiol-disulfide oxidoreductase family protein n=1 Tax=Gymnodinialimonas mytili TaxID=3126503 RepID=UPI0030B5B6FA
MSDPIQIVYDGECPFCSAYINMIRLREAAGHVELIDARAPHPILNRISAEGLDLDDGMVVQISGQLYHGDAAMTALAAMTTRNGMFNRIVRLLFSRPYVARVLYPPLKLGRAITLRLLGRSKING